MPAKKTSRVNWTLPWILTKKIQDSARKIESILESLKKQVYSSEELLKFKISLEENLMTMGDAQRQKNSNVWLHIKAKFESPIYQFDMLSKSFDTVFKNARLIWIAETLTKFDYFKDPNLVSTSISMLEAIYPDVKPVVAAIAAKECVELAMTAIQLQHQTTLEIQNQFASAMGFTNLDDTTRVPFAEVEKALEAAKQSQK